MPNDKPVGGSFRDPSGFVYVRDGVVLRQVNQSYCDNYDLLMSSGLYEKLVSDRSLISHEEIQPEGDAYKILRPEHIQFISFPYEWSFGQLKDAALLTLAIQKSALDHGLSLKDASAYNIQFNQGQPAFIDTLSFEKYCPGQPWVAYRQFCQHFLAPLALMSYTDIRLNQLLRTNLDGLPLDLAARLLPRGTKFRFSLLTHIHLHAKSQQRYAGKGTESRKAKVSPQALRGIIDSLEKAVQKLHWSPGGTEWAEYYDESNYSNDAFQQKQQLVASMVKKANPRTVWDLGANRGDLSRVVAGIGAQVVAFDIDPAAVEKNYRTVREKGETNILPLVFDLMNPSPSIGWANHERDSLIERGPADMVMALALVHHLAISNNLPLATLAKFFATIGKWLIIEFVPKSDSQVQRLLATRKDIFGNYDRESFETTFRARFDIKESEPITGSERILYLMKRQ